jgi:hypothetical protein
MRLSFVIFIIWSLSPGCTKDNNTTPNPPRNAADTPYPQYGTPFNGIPKTSDFVMYEVNLRAYSAGGDIQGVINRMDEIQALGVNVIWLMPTYPTGNVNSVNSPYSIRNYKAVSTEYGSLQDLRELTDAAHQRGMAVILDWVANHTAWDHPWISNKDWYTQDASGNIVHPPGTNWQDVADLNYDNEAMRMAMLDAMIYWPFMANIDGYRCDYADGVPYDFWLQAIDSVEAITGRDLIWFAEGSKKTHFLAGFDLCFGWNFYGQLKSVWQGGPPVSLLTTHDQEYQNTPASGHWLRFTTNHDESAWDATPVSIFNGIDGAIAASVASIFGGGAVLIYGSQEVGTPGTIPFFSNSQINWNANPQMKKTYEDILNFHNSSEVARKGVNSAFAAFPDVHIFKKTLGNEELVVIINVRNANSIIGTPPELKNEVWTDVMTGQSYLFLSEISLGPYEYKIFKN